MNRGVSIAALSTCGAAGLLAAALLAAAPGAGADDGTAITTPGTTTAPPPTETQPTTTTPVPPPPKLIAAGVTIGGTLVGGLTAAEAREVVATRFAKPLVLRVGPSGAHVVVTPRELGVSSQLDGALQLATRVRRPGFPVPLKVEVDRRKVERLVTSLGKRFHRTPLDASLKLRKLTPFATKDVPGRRLKEIIASRSIVHAMRTQMRDPLELPFETLAPSVTSVDLGHAIVIRRGSNQLFLYEVAANAKLVRRFKVATGRSQYPTPLGRFEVVNKQQNPWWYPPAGSEWAKDAKPIPPGPGNPLGTRWMGISSPNVGIHGTPDAASIGYSASHGCIRMLIPQVEWLFTQVDLGTPVFIVAA